MADNPHIHTKRVALLRRLLPILAGLGLVALIIGANRDLWGLFSGQSNLGLAANLAIRAPQFEGQLSNGQRFHLSAKAGAQKEDGVVSLNDLRMAIAAPDNASQKATQIQAQANSGHFSTITNQAEFSGQVILQDGHGNRLDTQTLQIDMAQGVLSAPQSLIFEGPSGRLQAQSLSADMQRGIYEFNNVTMRLLRNAP